jgi:nucleotide-binding universal stress UspA family protein
MVFLVPYDGSPLASRALDRAVEYGDALDREVVAVSYIPTGNSYAERRRWIDPDEDFAADSATQDLRRKIEEATDDTELRYDDVSAHSPSGGFSEEIRQTARDVDATVVFVGSAEDERIVVPLSEIDDEDYDVHIVRN